MKKNHFISGEWNLICDVCSKKIKAHEARHRWDGFIVCSDDFEMRHPQDFVKANTDKLTVPFTRPRPVDLFVDGDDKSVADVLSTIDVIRFQTTKVISDRINIDDTGQDYVDLTYFAGDYIGDITIVLQVNKILSDSTTNLESGHALLNPYIDSTYFADLYVGDYTQF